MNRIVCLLLVSLFSAVASAQQLTCEVVINAEQTGDANVTVLKTLENALQEFLNQTVWT